MFAEEAEKLLEEEEHRPSIPLLQGQFAMFVYEGNVDGGSKSIDYFMRMVETYEALNDVDVLTPQIHGKEEKSNERLQREMEGLSWIMWGVYCVEWFEVRRLCRWALAKLYQARITSIWIPKTSSKASN